MPNQKAIFAAGCFWGVEAAFRKTPGVIETSVGYVGGKTDKPSYKQVCTGRTGHAEAVEVTFDPGKISYPELLDVFWTAHDPTTLDRQGPDVGTQYRSAIFTLDEQQAEQAQKSLEEVDASKVLRRKIVTRIEPAGTFWPAEDYHQQYFEKQGMGDSCHVGPAIVHTKLAAAAAELRRAGAELPASSVVAAACKVDDPASACGSGYWKAQSDDELRARLTPEQYHIARQAGTEMAFTGKYWNEHRPGIYHCAVCGQDLFDAATKFDSGTGWPSFFKPIAPTAVIEHRDKSHGMVRTEVVCSRCQSHLGHVFNDGPKPTGLRYCMNSAVLELEPKGT